MNYLELILGQLPEAVYFVLFLIFTKKLNEKRLLFGLITIADYVLLLHIIPYNWHFHVVFIILLYSTLKLLYKDKSQITDVFLILIGYVFLAITSVVCYGIAYMSFPNIIFATVLNRVIIFATLFALNYKLYNIQNIYKNNWNRFGKNKIMKSVTFRSANLIIFNLTFFLINFCIIWMLSFRGWR